MKMVINENSDGWWKNSLGYFHYLNFQLTTGFIFSTGTASNIGITLIFWTSLPNINLVYKADLIFFKYNYVKIQLLFVVKHTCSSINEIFKEFCSIIFLTCLRCLNLLPWQDFDKLRTNFFWKYRTKFALRKFPQNMFVVLVFVSVEIKTVYLL